jgi:hypothetical protein
MLPSFTPRIPLRIALLCGRPSRMSSRIGREARVEDLDFRETGRLRRIALVFGQAAHRLKN